MNYESYVEFLICLSHVVKTLKGVCERAERPALGECQLWLGDLLIWEGALELK